MKNRDTKSSVITFRINGHNKELLIKEAKTNKVSLSFLINKVLNQHLSSKVIEKPVLSSKNVKYDNTKIRKFWLVSSIIGFFMLIWIFFSPKSKEINR